MKVKSGVYKLHIGESNFYIGSTKDPKRRLREHLTDLKKGIHVNKRMQKVYNELGPESVRMEILQHCVQKNLLIYEQRWMNKLKPNLNISPFSDRGPILSPEQIRESIEKAAQANRKIVYQYDLLGNYIASWPSVVAAAKSLNKKPGYIYHNVWKNTSAAYGFIWSYEFQPSMPPYEFPKSWKKICVYNLQGEFIEKINKAKDCCKKYKLSPVTLEAFICFKKAYKKYYFCLAENEFKLEDYFPPKEPTVFLYDWKTLKFYGEFTIKFLVKNMNMKKFSISRYTNSTKDQPYKMFFLRKDYCGELLQLLQDEEDSVAS
jgi:hypothetical protein